MILVYRYRVKSLNGLLNQQSRAVNFVWNFCNDRQKDALRFGRRWHTGFDLNKLTTGSSKELGLHSGTVNAVCEQYAKSRSQTQLAYKAVKHGAWFEEVSEAFSSQVCSNCGTLPGSRPRGIADLGIRSWVCSDCGCAHDRDVNAAKNILNKFGSPAGHGTPAVGIPVP